MSARDDETHNDTGGARSQADFARCRRNVQGLVLEGEALAEHTPVDEVVGEMVWAAGLVAEASGLGPARFVRLVAVTLGHLFRADVQVEVVPHPPKPRKRRKA